MVNERSYNIPLRQGFVNTPRWKRTKKAVSVLREFLVQHTKHEDVKIGMHLNQHIWKHGGKNPPHHVKVNVWIEDDNAKAELSGHDYKEALRVKKKEEPKSLKDKLAKKLGVDEKKEIVEEKKTEELKEIKEPVKDEKTEERKEPDKKEKKSETQKEEPVKESAKKEEPKEQVKKETVASTKPKTPKKTAKVKTKQ